MPHTKIIEGTCVVFLCFGSFLFSETRAGELNSLPSFVAHPDRARQIVLLLEAWKADPSAVDTSQLTTVTRYKNSFVFDPEKGMSNFNAEVTEIIHTLPKEKRLVYETCTGAAERLLKEASSTGSVFQIFDAIDACPGTKPAREAIRLLIHNRLDYSDSAMASLLADAYLTYPDWEKENVATLMQVAMSYAATSQTAKLNRVWEIIRARLGELTRIGDKSVTEENAWEILQRETKKGSKPILDSILELSQSKNPKEYEFFLRTLRLLPTQIVSETILGGQPLFASQLLGWLICADEMAVSQALSREFLDCLMELGERALPVMIKAYPYFDLESRLSLVYFFHKMREKALFGLLACISDSDNEIRRVALDGFRLLEEKAAPAVPLLIEMLPGSFNFDVSWALIGIGEKALPELITALSHPNEKVREGVIFVISGLKKTAVLAIPALTETALSDSHTIVRAHAIYALADFGAEAASAIPTLEHLFETDPELHVRVAAEAALQIIRYEIEREAEGK